MYKLWSGFKFFWYSIRNKVINNLILRIITGEDY